MSRSIPVKELIFIPAIITLAVTLVRLIGELLGGPALLFNSTAGGGGALVGIAWLVPIFGIYFAWKLIQMNAMSVSAWRALGIVVIAIVVTILIGIVSSLFMNPTSPAFVIPLGVGAVVAILICRSGWRELYDVLLAYAFAARIPVMLIMLIAMLGDWHTHYDLPPPDFPEMNVFFKWILIGVIPQMTFWIAYTLIIGFLFAVPVMLLKGRQPAPVDAPTGS